MDATEDYFEAEDAVGRWLDERCELGPSFMETSTALFADWKGWADANGEFVGSIRRFAETLVGKGFERWNTNKSKGFRGLSLRPNSTNTTSMEF
jgi:phage/plasmid-associated DNA primase